MPARPAAGSRDHRAGLEHRYHTPKPSAGILRFDVWQVGYAVGKNHVSAETPCVFCSAQIEPWVLCEGKNYRVIADAFPRVPGHILLITRRHALHHADAPPAWWPELEGATTRIREFLFTIGGAASFWENGYVDKEVRHAHLHGLPIQFPIA